MAKADPPVSIARPNQTNNKKILASRLRAIATLVLQGKKKEAWHALISLAEKFDPENR